MSAFSIIIPHYNDSARLERCLAALMPQADDAVEVIVADNGSSTDLTALQARWPEVRFVDQPEKGAGPARNAGAAASSAPMLGFLDADVVPDADWLATARRVAERGVVYGGAVTVFDETPPPRSGAEAFEAVFAFRVVSYLEKGFLASCQLVMTREDFAAVGGFRTEVSEDVDWSHRARAAGLRLALAPGLKVAHPSRSNWPALERKWRRLTSEGFVTEGQGSAWRRGRWAARALAMPLSVVAHVPQVLGHPGLRPGERARAIATLARLRVTRMAWMLRQAAQNRA